MADDKPQRWTMDVWADSALGQSLIAGHSGEGLLQALDSDALSSLEPGINLGAKFDDDIVCVTNNVQRPYLTIALEAPPGASRTSLEQEFGNVLRGIHVDPIIRPANCVRSQPYAPPLPHNPASSYEAVRLFYGQGDLQGNGMDGRGVMVAMMDSGVNIDYVTNRIRSYSPSNPHPSFNGKPTFPPRFEKNTYRAGAAPLKHGPKVTVRVHGTMMTFDVWVMAPRCTILDFPILRDNDLAGVLSNASKGYSILIEWKKQNPETSLVVNNSWYNPDPLDNAGPAFSDPDSCFNKKVEELDALGVDILFSAGNCGHGTFDKYCTCVQEAKRPSCAKLPNAKTGIYGPNSHPCALSITACDFEGRVHSFASGGPGDLEASKPDTAVYSHFRGAGFEKQGGRPDSGTSASCAVASGIVAAVRSKYPSSQVSTAKLRELVHRSSSVDGVSCWDRRYGWGLLEPPRLVQLLESI